MNGQQNCGVMHCIQYQRVKSHCEKLFEYPIQVVVLEMGLTVEAYMEKEKES